MLDYPANQEDAQEHHPPVRKRYVSLGGNLSLLVKAYPHGEVWLTVMVYDNNCGWQPVRRISFPTARAAQVMAAIAEVLR